MRSSGTCVASTTARTTNAAKSSGRTAASAPPYRPIGVRSASTTHTSRPCGIGLRLRRLHRGFFIQVEHPKGTVRRKLVAFCAGEALQYSRDPLCADLPSPRKWTDRIVRSQTHRNVHVVGRRNLVVNDGYRFVDDGTDDPS